MSLRTQKTTTTTYRTVNVPSSPEPVATKTVVSGGTMLSGGTVVSGGTMLTGQTVVSGGTVSPLPYAQNGSYETVRYLVPVQQAAMQQQQSFYLMPQQSMVQPVMQCVSPVYLQTLPRLSVSSQESDLHYRQRVESTSGKSSVFSQPASPIKSPEPSAEEEEEEEEEEENGEVELEEVEIVNIIQTKAPPPIQNISRTDVKIDVRDTYQPEKLDTRYFGELLADVYRKNCDIHSCISDHVSKIRGQKYQVDLSSSDFKEVEALIPKGATELTKQQIRYLLQTRLTADKSMRLLLSTFNSLREELLHMSADLRRLESEKEALERDLSFKADQARQYDSLLEAVRDNNRQLQASLKETTATQRSLETQLMSTRNTDSSREFKIKELEGKLKALESENNMLRQKLAGQGSSTATLHMKTEELSRQYNEQLSAIRQEKEREIERLKSQITKIRTEVTTTTSSSAEKSLQLKISELLSQLDQRQTIITRQEEEIRKLMQERNDSSKNVTKTIITKKYRNQYPILGLLSDDYQATSPVKEAKTIIIERTGEMIKEE